jgi:hypothetical protein
MRLVLRKLYMDSLCLWRMWVVTQLLCFVNVYIYVAFCKFSTSKFNLDSFTRFMQNQSVL